MARLPRARGLEELLKKKKARHGPIPTYETRRSIEIIDMREYAWLTQPDPAPRRYDSSLSKPGRICKRCRGFVAGGVIQCPECWAES